MCEFFSFITKGDGVPVFFPAELRKNMPDSFRPDSHSSISAYFGLDDDKVNKYEFVNGQLIVDTRGYESRDKLITDDSKQVEKWVKEFVKTEEFINLRRATGLPVIDNVPSKPKKPEYAIPFRPKLGIYKGCNDNCSFDPKTFIGLSYKWWLFVKKIKGKVVFNNYRYSNTTSKHQYKMKNLLNQLGIKIDIFVECPKGLQNLESGINFCQNNIEILTEQCLKKGTRAATNARRQKEIKRFQEQIKTLKKLMR